MLGEKQSGSQEVTLATIEFTYFKLLKLYKMKFEKSLDFAILRFKRVMQAPFTAFTSKFNSCNKTRSRKTSSNLRIFEFSNFRIFEFSNHVFYRITSPFNYLNYFMSLRSIKISNIVFQN